MKNSTSAAPACVDPMSEFGYPALQPFTGSQPTLPKYWKCTALLHPFSPLQSNSTDADKKSPFFELCIATVYYAEGVGMNARLKGSSGRQWWYNITPDQTSVSTDGKTFTPIDMGWSVPGTNWFGKASANANCAGTSYLNWMKAQQVNWWKIPVGTTDPKPATWMWFDSESNFPVRLMFGQGPASCVKGDVDQLALFQMFSFTYFPAFEALTENPLGADLPDPAIDGFSFGNPKKYDLFEWNYSLGFTALMTPVNEAFNPLPTRVLYNWKTDQEYRVTADRSQHTLMKYTYNPQNAFDAQVALLTGPAPASTSNPPANSGAGFLINYKNEEVQECVGFGNFPFPQEPPNWIQLPGVEGTIQATIVDNSVLCPNHPVTVLSVLFPPALPNYPDSTYLWTWYSPTNLTGTTSRPVTFMQSQSGVGVGTSLALADYFDFKEFDTQVPACNFDVPPCDFTVAAKPVKGTPSNPDPSYPWLDTGIPMNPGTVATISYVSGLWTANPEDNDGQLYDASGNPEYINAKPGYTMPNQNEGALIGKIGDVVFLIGNHAVTPDGLTGNLELCINDDLYNKYGAGLSDNIGSVTVEITVANK